MKKTHLRTILFLAFIFFFDALKESHSSSFFEGNWKLSALCSGIDEASCIAVDEDDYSDTFMLFDLTQSGDWICGYHMVTGNRQRRVDEGDLDGSGPSISGAVRDKNAEIQFRSALTGNVGNAIIRFKDGKLAWHTVKPLDGENWFPTNAILSPTQSTEKNITRLDCGEKLGEK